MWTVESRKRYERSHLRYPSDLTDEEWQHVEPLIPLAKPGGRKREVNIREVVNGVMYVLSTGCQWRYLPKDLPPKSTVFHYFNRWNCDGTFDVLPWGTPSYVIEKTRPVDLDYSFADLILAARPQENCQRLFCV
jgi:hypothetical protein